MKGLHFNPKYALPIGLAFAIAILPYKSQAQDASSLPTLDSLPTLFLSSLSPVILDKDGIEVNNFNPLTSFWLAVQETPPELGGAQVTNRYRYTLFESYWRVSYGFGYNKRWDLGAEFRFSRRRLDDQATNSSLKVFGSDDPGSITYQGLSMVGIRGRYMPLRKVPELTLQGALTFPVAKEEVRHGLSLDRTQFELGATYYKNLVKRTYYFLQTNWLARFANSDNDRTTHQFSASAFFVEGLFHNRVYLYPGLTYAGNFQKFGDGSFNQISYQILGGIGVQYQPVRFFSASLYGQIPFTLESGSATTEWVRESYSSWTLGLLFRI